MELKVRNVNVAFNYLTRVFSGAAKERDLVEQRNSRNGPVLMINEPVTVTYTSPKEKVLFNAARDANPFLHLYESLWMLAGRNDVAPLAYYAKQFREYSDDGVHLNGAYGARWRYGVMSERFGTQTGTGVDQLDLLVNHLKANPESRRAVLQMWNVEDDLLKIDSSRDVCCNLSVMFSLREETRVTIPQGDLTLDDKEYTVRVLDMTVTNRSNDLVWGLLGANVVHFSFLQEYMAARLGVEVGVYNQFTNNIHVYEWNWKPKEWLAADDAQPFGFHPSNSDDWEAQYRQWNTVPLIRDPEVFEKELPEFVKFHSRNPGATRTWKEPFLDTVAELMLTAFHLHKLGRKEQALQVAACVYADDWRIAAEAWLRRRLKKEVE